MSVYLVVSAEYLAKKTQDLLHPKYLYDFLSGTVKTIREVLRSPQSPSPLFLFQQTAKKEPAERGHVKKRQKSSKSAKSIFATLFDIFRTRQKTSKNRQKVSKLFSTVLEQHRFSGPFGGGGLWLLPLYPSARFWSPSFVALSCFICCSHRCSVFPCMLSLELTISEPRLGRQTPDVLLGGPEAPGLKKFNLERQYWKNQAFNTEWHFQSGMVFSFWAPLWPQKNRAWDWEWKFRAWGNGFFMRSSENEFFRSPGPKGGGLLRQSVPQTGRVHLHIKGRELLGFWPLFGPPTLIFFSLLLLEKGKKNHQKNKDLCSPPNLSNSWEGREKRSQKQGFPCRPQTKKTRKNKL